MSFITNTSAPGSCHHPKELADHVAELLDVGFLVLQHANALLNQLLLLIYDVPDQLCRLVVEVHECLQLLVV